MQMTDGDDLSYYEPSRVVICCPIQLSEFRRLRSQRTTIVIIVLSVLFIRLSGLSLFPPISTTKLNLKLFTRNTRYTHI